MPNALFFIRFYSTTYNGWSLGADGANGEQFRITRRMDATLNTPYLVMDTAGNVGIGTTAPQATLEVNGTAQIDQFITHRALGAMSVHRSSNVSIAQSTHASQHCSSASRI